MPRCPISEATLVATESSQDPMTFRPNFSLDLAWGPQTRSVSLTLVLWTSHLVHLNRDPPSGTGLSVPPHANSTGALAGRGRSWIRCVRLSPAPSPSLVPPSRSPQGPPPCSPARREQVRAPRQPRLRAGPGRGRELGEAPAVAAGPAPPGLRRSGDSGGRAPAAGRWVGAGEDAPSPWSAARAQSRPRGEAGEEARRSCQAAKG